MSPPVITESHRAEVGGMSVRRALPRRERRTIGAWCFVDHIGPLELAADAELDTAPHPHCGLQTVTWLIEGDVLHRDSLGSEQPIRPGQLNLMTAGHGVSHSEEQFGRSSGRAHGVQLWVALPEQTRHGPAGFEHHAELPVVEFERATATVLVGAFGGVRSPARADTDHVGIDLLVRAGTTVLPLQRSCEYGIVVTEGTVLVAGEVLTPGQLAYLAPDSDEVNIATGEPARVMLIGGTPFESKISMFWNFVARTHDEIDLAVNAWQSADGRFGEVDSALQRIPSPIPPWRR